MVLALKNYECFFSSSKAELKGGGQLCCMQQLAAHARKGNLIEITFLPIHFNLFRFLFLTFLQKLILVQKVL